MAELKQRITERLNGICDQFIKEKIGNVELTLMPPKDKVPIITRINYNESDDAFEIFFNECENYKYNSKNNVDFLEDQFGHLMAIRIRDFSNLELGTIMIDVLATIENEIQQVSLKLLKKQDILNKVIDKRKLIFLDTMVKEDYKEIKNAYVK